MLLARSPFRQGGAEPGTRTTKDGNLHMASEWDRGILAKSSWHGLEEIGTMPDAAAMIAAAERTGAWPTRLTSEAMTTASGLAVADAKAIVASYAAHPSRVLGVVGGRYRATSPEEWRGIVEAAAAAGAKPTGAFALRDGARILGTFEVGIGNGLRTNLLMCDSFDGSMALTCGYTTIDVVCANTLAVSLGKDGGGMAKIRHTASAADRIEDLRKAIAVATECGQKIRDAYAHARETRLDRDQAKAVFDALFPEAAEDATQNAKTRADNVRIEAMRAAAMPINLRGNAKGTLATMWNTATWLVDRDANGNAQKDGGTLDSLLFGARAKRVQEIQTIIELAMRDGSVKRVPASEALAMPDLDKAPVRRALLDDMIENA